MNAPSHHRTAPRWSALAVVAAAAVTAWLSYFSGAAGIGTSDRDYVFSLADPPWSQSMVAALDVPVGGPPTASALAARASIAIAKGRRGAARDFAAVATAAAVAAGGAWLLAAGIPVFPAGLTLLAMASSALFWSRGIAWSSGALSPALGLVALWAFWRWLETGGRSFAVITTLSAALALSDDAAWLALVPAIGILIWRRAPVAQRTAALVTVIVVAALAAWPVMARALVAREIAWAATSGDVVPGAYTLWALSVLGAAATPGMLLRDLSRDFTPLGVALAITGAAVAWRAASNRLALAVAVLSLLFWYWLTPRSRFEPLSVPMVVCGWWCVATALSWLQSAAPARTAHALVALVAALLVAEPTLTRSRLSALGKDLPSDARVRMASDLRIGDLPRDSVLVAESRRVDAAILTASRLEGQPATIVPQSIDLIRAMMPAHTIVALPEGEASLERVGFLFERMRAHDAAVSAVAGYVPCESLVRGRWPDVSLSLASRSFSIHGVTPTAPPSGVVLRLAADEPVRILNIEPRGTPFETSNAPRDPAMVGVTELDQAAVRDGARTVTTIRLPETGRVDAVTVTLNRVPSAAVATSEGPGPAALCAGVIRGELTIGRADNASATLRMNAGEAFGVGWHPLEADPDHFRWTAAPHAALRVTMAQPRPVRVTVTATPAARPAQRPAIDLTVNGCELPAHVMRAGQGDYEWTVGEDCWRPGYNRIWIGTSPLISPASLGGGHDTRLLGARIGAVRFERVRP